MNGERKKEEKRLRAFHFSFLVVVSEGVLSIDELKARKAKKKGEEENDKVLFLLTRRRKKLKWMAVWKRRFRLQGKTDKVASLVHLFEPTSFLRLFFFLFTSSFLLSFFISLLLLRIARIYTPLFLVSLGFHGYLFFFLFVSSFLLHNLFVSLSFSLCLRLPVSI